MSSIFDLNDLEELTLNAEQIQDDLLKQILTLNTNTEYLRQFLHGSTDKQAFKKNVPLVSYEDVKPYIERVANGEPSDVISGAHVTTFLRSSGTSGGIQKIFPANNLVNEQLGNLFALRSRVTAKYFSDKCAEQGKAMEFIYNTPESTTPSGLPIAGAISTFYISDYFKNQPSNSFVYTSPDQVILCPDSKQSVYCHLLCGLSQKNEVVKVGASFAHALVQAMSFLESNWKELCNNIRLGRVSEWITDLDCRSSVSMIIGGPNPELADRIEQECNHKSWEGQMAQYVPILEFYSNKLPLVSTIYGSSESIFGMNVDPLCKPQDVSYTFVPSISYFEFLPVDHGGDMSKIVDLVNVKLGCYYEPVVTTYFGLNRYLIGDILQVTGFYNNTPQFRFVRRKNMVLSVSVETTTEEDIMKALTCATFFLNECSNLMLVNLTCNTDISTLLGHYVFYLELKGKEAVNEFDEISLQVLVECCFVIEQSFGGLYKRMRRSGFIGPLEIRVMQQGTFDALMDYFMARGGSMAQYKTPICINSSDALAVFENKVLVRFHGEKYPPLDP